MSIQVINVTKKFGDFTALNQINFEVASGELIALLGPSGSGKTTLLRVIAGLEPLDAGQVIIRGSEMTDKKVSDRKVGFVFQHYALFRHMSVFENVAFGLRVRPKAERPNEDEIKKRVTELLRLVRLDGMAGRFPSQLSGGQRQRVALARSLAIEPSMLLLDEPFGALDAKVRKELRQWLRDLHDKLHMTSVFVTHDQEEALEVADRIVVMNQGRIEQIGTPEEVYHHPASPFVYDFLGNMNVFHGRLDDGQIFLSEGDVQTKQKIYVRPHSMEVSKKNSPGAFQAEIRFVNAAGPMTKLELNHREAGTLWVEIPRDKFLALGVKKGDTVFVTPKEAHVFTDYSI